LVCGIVCFARCRWVLLAWYVYSGAFALRNSAVSFQSHAVCSKHSCFGQRCLNTKPNIGKVTFRLKMLPSHLHRQYVLCFAFAPSLQSSMFNLMSSLNVPAENFPFWYPFSDDRLLSPSHLTTCIILFFHYPAPSTRMLPSTPDQRRKLSDPRA